MSETKLLTNHAIRVVNLVTGDRVLCLFSDLKNDDGNIMGYRMVYPYVLELGEVNEEGNIPIEYKRWCPFSPQEEHRIAGDHIISVVYPDNNIVMNFADRLRELGLKEDQIFYPEEETDGDNSEPAEAGE